MKQRSIPSLFSILILICFLLVSFLFFLGKKKRDFKEIRKEGILKIVTEYNQYDYYISGDTIEGFQYALGKAISNYSGLNVEIHLEMNLAKSFEGLTNGKYDVIARNIPITSELKQNFLFTDPIVYNKQVLVQRTAEANNNVKPIRNQLDLAKKKLYIPRESPVRLRLDHLAHEIGDTIYIIEDSLYSSEQLMIMVAKGDIDYAVCDRQSATILQKRLPEIDIQTDISFTQLQCWAVRKESPILLDSLNHWMKEIRENGLFDEIYNKYYRKR